MKKLIVLIMILLFIPAMVLAVDPPAITPQSYGISHQGGAGWLLGKDADCSLSRTAPDSFHN